MIRIYKDDNFAEFEWLVGGIPIADGIGKEIVTRFHTDINSAGNIKPYKFLPVMSGKIFENFVRVRFR